MTRNHRWTVDDAAELYGVGAWGKGYFAVNERGHVAVCPRKGDGPAIDLRELVERLRGDGLELPLLIRFTDLLRHRVAELNGAFEQAIADNDYQGRYCAVYPIKVNQQRRVVEDLVECSETFDFGLECGSRPELLAVLALTPRTDIPIICNGFKDEDFIELVTLAQKMGKRVIPVIEKYSELRLILDRAERLGVRPCFGVRTKLSAPGAGRWKLSTGDRSKFGLTATGILELLAELKSRGLADCLKLLHFHIGSQVTNIYSIKSAITEAARIYVDLVKRGAGLEMLDVGGGLGIDYDGSQTNFESSVNYSLEEYAGDVVARIQGVCDEADVAHPTIVTESGRALVAYHSVLVTNVLDVSKCLPDTVSGSSEDEIVSGKEHLPPPLESLRSLRDEVTSRNAIECYHDAVQHYDEAISTFNLGFLSLEQRGLAERLYYRAVQQILRVVRTLDRVPEELEGIEDQLFDTYFCNFSVFQSIPDSWAVGQLFPIMPIHRLERRPRRRAVLADLTCDSDGKVDRFIDLRDVRRTLDLHAFDGTDYYLGIFLVGAYQEILGDLHNLFGDTNSVHVELADPEGPDPSDVQVHMVVEGDTVEQVLSYVQYSSSSLVRHVREHVQEAVKRGNLTPAEARHFVNFYRRSLDSYTYLTPGRVEEPRAEKPALDVAPRDVDATLAP